MANPSLVNYIREQMSRGYDAQAIRQYLIQYGYTPADVDSALSELGQAHVRHTIHITPATLIGICVVFVVILTSGFFLFQVFSEDEAKQLLDLNLEPVLTTTTAGSEITFVSELTNFGSSKRYDISLKYELVHSATSEKITEKEETRGIETLGSKQIKMEIPSSAKPGNYLLRALAIYNDQRAVATLPVIITEGKPSDELPSDENETKIPHEEEPVDPEPTERDDDEPIDPDEIPGTSLTTFEAIEKVEKLAKQNRREAEALCKSLELQTSRDLCYNKIGETLGDKAYCKLIVEERTRDVCYSNVAKQINQHAICEEISKDSRKDSCYMNFVIDKKEYTVCIKVNNQYLRQSCESLKQLSELNITDVAFYESVLNQSLIEFI